MSSSNKQMWLLIPGIVLAIMMLSFLLYSIVHPKGLTSEIGVSIPRVSAYSPRLEISQCNGSSWAPYWQIERDCWWWQKNKPSRTTPISTAKTSNFDIQGIEAGVILVLAFLTLLGVGVAYIYWNWPVRVENNLVVKVGDVTEQTKARKTGTRKALRRQGYKEKDLVPFKLGPGLKRQPKPDAEAGLTQQRIDASWMLPTGIVIGVIAASYIILQFFVN